MMNRHMQSRILIALSLAFAVAAVSASARDRIPVYGPARVGVEDGDLLADTVLELGVLAIDQAKPTEIRIGDGITPGGIPIHPDGCVTGFVQIANATTNLNMHHYSIQWGAWRAQGDSTALNFTYGDDEVWLRFVRDSGEAYLSYDFTIAAPDVYQFTVASAEGDPAPVLQVATNLLEGYLPAPAGSYGTSRPDAAHLVITYTNSTPSDFIFFRVFDAAGLDSGAYFNVPIVPADGITMGTNNVKEWTDLDYWFIPKWPGWYQFGNGGPSPSLDSIGLFSMFGGLYFQNVDNNISIVAKGNAPMSITPGADVSVNSVSGSVRIAAGMPVGQMPLLSRGLILGSTNGVVIDAPSVTWNGVSKHSWDDITAGVAAGVSSNAEAIADIAENYLPKWPAWYQLGTNGDYPSGQRTGLYSMSPDGKRRIMELSCVSVDSDTSDFTISANGLYFKYDNWTALRLRSAGLLNLQGYQLEAKATAASTGLTLTNSANGEFTVTWNGIAKHGWEDITAGVTSNLTAHCTDTNNPHSTTPDGIGMLDWLWARGLGVDVDSSVYGVYRLYGFNNNLSFEETLWKHWAPVDFAMISTNATWDFRTPTAPKWNGAPLATAAAVSDAVAVVQGAATTNAGNIATNAAAILAVSNTVDTLAATVSAIDADYLTSSDASGFATTGAVASVERRVEALEYPETCTIWWSDSNIKSGTGASDYNWIPTNFPTRKLRLYIYVTNGVHVFSIPDDFAPDLGKTVTVVHLYTGPCTNYLRFGSALIHNTAVSSGTSIRAYEFVWDPCAKAWTLDSRAEQVPPYTLTTSGRYDSPPPGVPSTVEEWLEQYQPTE